MTTNLSARLEVQIVFPAYAAQQRVKDSSTNRSVTFLLSTYITGIGNWEALVWIFIIHFTALEFCGPLLSYVLWCNAFLRRPGLG